MNPLARGWRMLEMCDNCPFAPKGRGAALRRALRPGRLRGIKAALRRGEDFPCHKTTTFDEAGEPVRTRRERLCAGAIAYQNRHGRVSDYRQVCERLDAWAGHLEEVLTDDVKKSTLTKKADRP